MFSLIHWLSQLTKPRPSSRVVTVLLEPRVHKFVVRNMAKLIIVSISYCFIFHYFFSEIFSASFEQKVLASLPIQPLVENVNGVNED